MIEKELLQKLIKVEQRVEALVKPEVGRWQDWTPAIYQNGNVASTVDFARYIVKEDLVTLVAVVTATAAGSATNNIYVLGPAALTPQINNNHPIGAAQYADGSVWYSCHVVYSTTVSGQPAFGFRVNTVTDGNVIGVNPNIAVASGDIISFTAAYER